MAMIHNKTQFALSIESKGFSCVIPPGAGAEIPDSAAENWLERTQGVFGKSVIVNFSKKDAKGGH